ncbi:hypothetical protein A4U60_13040 [Priestia endophytica]|nr:hypothetical protein A4U60_13040 [Priestia endophytica]
MFIPQLNFAFSWVVLTKQKINAKFDPIFLSFHGNNYYTFVEMHSISATNPLVAHLFLFYIKRKLFICFGTFFLKGKYPSTTTTLVVSLTKGKIYKHTCMPIYKTVHITHIFPHM